MTNCVERRSEDPVEDKRETSRRRVLWRGKLIDDGRNSVLDCQVRNISASGALVEIEFGTPARFSRLITADGRDTGYRVAWTNGRRSGLRFDPSTVKTTDAQ